MSSEELYATAGRQGGAGGVRASSEKPPTLLDGYQEGRAADMGPLGRGAPMIRSLLAFA